MLNSIKGITQLRILDAHLPATFAAMPHAVPLHPDTLVAYALKYLSLEFNAPPVVIIPDAGAVARTTAILTRLQAR